MFRRLIILCIFALTAPPALAEGYDGRRVVITDGRADPSKAGPLVVAMHGFLGTGRNMRKKTGFDQIARRYGAVVAYPNGKRRRWNDGRSPGAKVDDVGYLTGLIRALVAQGRVDPERVFLAGHSNGGGMAMRMACAHPRLIRGIAVVATKSALNFRCSGGAPVPALYIHGTLDPILPHGGRVADSRLGGALSAEATMAHWHKRNRCRGVARRQRVDRVDDGTSAQVIDYGGCAARLRYVLIEGHGHDWPRPGGRATLLQGPATQELSATALSWQFFDSL